jgi:16S rRNA C967 or C1407 C5-methylase (RsmB/RsmF family)
MFTNIAKGHPRDDIDKMLDDLKKSKGYKLDTEVKADELKELVKKYKEYYKKTFKEEFPTDPYMQLVEAIKAVLNAYIESMREIKAVAQAGITVMADTDAQSENNIANANQSIQSIATSIETEANDAANQIDVDSLGY